MKTSKLFRWLGGLAAFCLTLSCEPDRYPVSFDPPQTDELQWADLPLSIGLDTPGAEGTKATLLQDVEAQGTGVLVLVFRTETGRMVSYHYYSQSELRNQGGMPLSLRVPLAVCDFYILGNLNAIRKSDGKAVSLMDGLGADFPVDESSLEAMVYRLDGGDLNGAYRRERFAEVASCGIPYVLVRKSVNTVAQLSAGQGIPDSDRCKRLFSRLTVRIDHGAFDGSGANPEYFVNKRLYLRQVNGRLQPFSGIPQRAAEAADILSESDYDPDMQAASASVTTYCFYVPENMQGTLLPDNTDSGRKTREELLAQGKSAVEPFLTYVEFTGEVNPAAGGYGGEVTYRFYAGADNCSNFDLARGRSYDIRLGFRVGSLFEPDWKVQPDSWTDTRLFCLTADAAFTDRLEDARTVAVRKNRDGAFYLYMNPAGALGAVNALIGREAASSAGFVPSSLADCSWYADWMSPASPDGAWLAARGIQPVWDKTNGRLRFSVTDAGLFDSHRGEERILSLTLLPNGASARFKIRLCDDIQVAVAGGKSLTDEFYLGQKRTVTFSGFLGGTFCYAADQDPCGSSAAGSAHTANRQWKADNGGGAFPTAVVDAAGSVSLKAADYPSQRLAGGSLDIYAFYPNRFQPGHGGWVSQNGKILLFSEDYLNDSVELDLRISEPLAFRPSDYSGTTYLPLDGNEVAVPQVGYKTFDGSAFLSEAAFDPTLYASLLALRLNPLSTDPADFLTGVEYDPAGSRMSLRVTSNGSGNIEDRAFDSQGIWNTGKYIQVVTNDATGLFRGQTGLEDGVLLDRRIRFSKIVVEGYSADGGLHWATDPSEARFSVSYFGLGVYGNSIDPFVDDEEFNIWVNYRGRGFDWSRVSVERSGPQVTYTCPSGDTYGPVLTLVEDMADTGYGGRIKWHYDESSQVMRSAHDEFVPGGLLIPYGEQTVSFRYRNKWDGRTFQTLSNTLTLNYVSMFGWFVGATNRQYASVYYIPLKNQKYLMRIDSTVGRAQRQQMLSFLGTTGWYANKTCTNLYHKDSATWAPWYFVEGTGLGFPRSDFDVRYLEGSYSSAVRWSSSAVDALMSKRNNWLVYGDSQIPHNGWGSPYIANENGANGSTLRAVFVNTTDTFH